MSGQGLEVDSSVPSDHDRAWATLPVAALSHPRETLQTAKALLTTATTPSVRSLAAQAKGIALRELGQVGRALQALDLALREARQVSAARQADVEASIGGTLAYAGRTSEGLIMIDSALTRVSGAEAARIRVRRGLLLQIAGHPVEAAADLRAAGRQLRDIGDLVWEGRAMVNLAQALLDLGQTEQADNALSRAEELQVESTFDAGVTRQNRGLVAVLEGRIPDALSHYDTAEQRFAVVGARPPALSGDRASALRQAGLFADAMISAQEELDLLRKPGAPAAYRAHALVRAADLALLTGQIDAADAYAVEALKLFRRQGRDRGVTQARLALARTRRASGQMSTRLSRELADIADTAATHRMPEAVEANLLAGEVALAAGMRDAARIHLARAKRGRYGRRDTTKVLGWRAAAVSAQAYGRRAATLSACDSGLGVLEAHQATLGALEMRAATTAHGVPLAQIALRACVESGNAHLMLQWVERWRSTTLRLPVSGPPEDAQLAAELAQLRLARLRADDVVAERRKAVTMQEDIGRLESSVRARTHRTSLDGDLQRQAFELPDALAELAGTTLIEIFVLDGDVHVLIADDDGVRHTVTGRLTAALRAIEFARFSLRRMSHRAFAERARVSLSAQAVALERALLGPVTLRRGPVLVVPPAALSSAPWGVLPALCERTVQVAASTASWWMARRAAPTSTRVALVGGPALAQADAEVDQLAHLYPAANHLRPGSATCDAVLDVLDGAELAHVAAHGTFRADNPLFSSLQFDDGPLTVYDLQRLRRAPHRLVLSCCDTGTVSAAGADEALGLASALVPLGMAGMIAASVPVPDRAAVPFALRLHEQLRAGASSAQALRAVRRQAAASDDLADYAMAHSFTAFGAL